MKTKSFAISGLIALSAAGLISAADDTHNPVVGFEFGAGYNQIFDDRFTGYSTSFALIFQIGEVMSAGIYQENVRLAGEQEGAHEDVDGTLQEVRARAQLWNGAHQNLIIFLGLGLAEYDFRNTDEQIGGIVGDVGISFGIVRARSGPVIGQVALEVLARFSPVDDVDVSGFDPDETVDNLDTLRIGLTAGLYF